MARRIQQAEIEIAHGTEVAPQKLHGNVLDLNTMAREDSENK